MWALLPTKAAMAAPITRMSSSLSPSATAGRAGGGDGASPGAFVSASVLTIAAADFDLVGDGAGDWPLPVGPLGGGSGGVGERPFDGGCEQLYAKHLHRRHAGV